ncbi:PadR family transcriptional regulator [Embleya sp. NPDC001921]
MRRHIIDRAVEREFHSAWMLADLAGHDFEVTFATVNPLLRRMEADGVLVAERREIEGRARRMYRASEATRMELAEERRALAEAIREVLPAGRPDRPQVPVE